MQQLVAMTSGQTARCRHSPHHEADRARADVRGLQWLLGTYFSRREPDRAEAAFLKAIELEPSLIEAYVKLAQIYGIAQRYDQRQPS
jgi:Tfp pilus assembly protein PilF